MLTAISTVLGMIPIAPTVFWGPMAVSIMGGLLVATLLTLVFLPTAYVAMFGTKTKAKAEPVEAKHETREGILLAVAPADLRLDRDQLIARHRSPWPPAPLISAALAYVFARKFEIWRGIRFSPQRLYHFILYTGVFLVELVRANINMMRYVYAPRIERQSRRREGEDRLEIADRPARSGELDQPNAGFARPRYERGGTHACIVSTCGPSIPNDPSRTIARPFEKHLEKSFG